VGAGADLLAVELLEGVVVGDGVAAAPALDGLDRGLRGLDRGLGGPELLRDQERDQSQHGADHDEDARDDQERGPVRKSQPSSPVAAANSSITHAESRRNSSTAAQAAMMPALTARAVISFFAMSISWWTTPRSSSRMDWTSSPMDRWVG